MRQLLKHSCPRPESQRQARGQEAAAQYEAAGDAEAACRCWRLAARQAWEQQQYRKAVQSSLEALRLARGPQRWEAALEAARLHHRLGQYQPAQRLASLLLQTPDLPLQLRQKAEAIWLQAHLLAPKPVLEPAREHRRRFLPGRQGRAIAEQGAG